jgi:hypothetical protein
MLAFLPCVATSTWWNFSNAEFAEKKRNSLTLPIFVVCYSHWCPHCSGLPEGTVQYSDSDGNRSDVLVTMIDCADQHSECSHFRIGGTPHMVLVIGQHRKYWPRVYSKVGKDWNVFIDKYVKSSLREVKSDTELLAAKREPTDGGTTFHLETPTSDIPLMAELANLSKEFRIYNDTFTYVINSKLERPFLTAFTSPDCPTKWTTGTLRQFLESHKFGNCHEYDQDEYRLLSRRAKATVLVVEEGLSSGQGYALQNVRRNYCSRITFGWLKAKNSKHLLSEFKKNTSDLPFLIYSDENKCRAFYRGRTAEAGPSGFLEMALQGELCGKWYPGGPVSREELQEPRFTGGDYSMVYVIGGLSLVTLIRICTQDGEAKQE